MRAGIYLGNNLVRTAELPIPEIGSDDVLIENIYAAVTDADIALVRSGSYAGTLITPGMELGSAAISRVADFGMNLMDFNLGERVFPDPRFLHKDPQKRCIAGAFSEFMLAEEAERNFTLYPIPDSISDRTACLMGFFAAGARAARSAMKLRSAEQLYYILSEKEPYQGDIRYADNENAIVFGAGTLGLATAVMLKWFGMENVMVCDTSDLRLGIAANLGMETCNLSKEDFSAKTASVFPAGINAWINTQDAGAILPKDMACLSLFMNSSRPASRYIEAAETAASCQIDFSLLAASGRQLIGAGSCTGEDVDDAAAVMGSGYFRIEEMITHEFPVEQLNEALEIAADPEISGTVILRF